MFVVAYSDDVTIIDDVDWSDAGFSNVQITYRNNQENTNVSLYLLNRPSIEIDYTIDETDDAVHFERIGDIGYIYINEDLLTTIEFDEQQMTRASVNIPSQIRTFDGPGGSGFSDFYYVKQTSWRINAFEQLFYEELDSYVVSTIVAAIIGAYAAPIVVISYHVYSTAQDMVGYLNTLLNISSILTDDKLNGVDLMYRSFNNQCDILGWYGGGSYMLQNGEINLGPGINFMSNQNHTWDGHPYDYSQPAACRVLVNTYP